MPHSLKYIAEKDYFSFDTVKNDNPEIELDDASLSFESVDHELHPVLLLYRHKTTVTYHRDVWEAVYPEIILPE